MSYAIGKIMIDNLLNESEKFKNMEEELEKKKKENQELKVKCNKLLNDNFLLVAQYNNIKNDLEFIMQNFCIEPDEFSYIAYEDKYIFEEFEYVIELTPEEFERYKKISSKK